MENKQSNILIAILLLGILISISFTYYRYITKEDFNYFTEEESVPDMFNIDSYKK